MNNYDAVPLEHELGIPEGECWYPEHDEGRQSRRLPVFLRLNGSSQRAYVRTSAKPGVGLVLRVSNRVLTADTHVDAVGVNRLTYLIHREPLALTAVACSLGAAGIAAGVAAGEYVVLIRLSDGQLALSIAAAFVLSCASAVVTAWRTLSGSA